MRHAVLLLVVTLAGCESKPRPEDELKTVIKSMEEEGAIGLPVQLPGRKTWVNYQPLAKDTTYEINTSVIPIKATLTSDEWARTSKEFLTSKEAASAPVTEGGPSGSRGFAEMVFRDGRWIVRDVGLEGLGMKRDRSTDPDASQGWWITLGGSGLVRRVKE